MMIFIALCYNPGCCPPKTRMPGNSSFFSMNKHIMTVWDEETDQLIRRSDFSCESIFYRGRGLQNQTEDRLLLQTTIKNCI